MTINLLQTPEYQTLMKEHIENTLLYLFEKNQEFALLCQMKHTFFTPELPTSIQEGFQENVLFVLSNYSLESCLLEEGTLSFEAGFGEENLGSTVSLPLLAIKQIFLGESPILVNLSHPTAKTKASPTNSMEALLRNPENQKLLKKMKS